MLDLRSNNRPVRLSPGTSVQLEYHSPLFDEDVVRGSFSYAFTVPAPPNGPLYGFPERLDADATPGAELPAELYDDGLPLLVGTQRVRTASAVKYSVNLSGALGALATSLSGRALAAFAYGGVRQLPPGEPLGGAGSLLQLPGWVRHANEVALHPEAYDYVFAPVRCDDFYPAPALADGEVRQPIVLNPWVTADPAAFNYGLPAGGSFAYLGVMKYADFNGVTLPVYGQLASPFPRLRYVLRCLFEESGLRVDEPNFLPGELGDLVIFSPANAVRCAPDAAGVVQSSFHLADALPDLTVAQLLAALRRDLGLVVLLDEAAQRVRTALLRDVVAEPAGTVPDLTAALAGPAEVTIDDAATYQLVYQLDPDDVLATALLKQEPDPATLSPAVETLADLPATAPLGAAAQTRLVRQEDAYYQSRPTLFQNPTTLAWTLLGPALAGVAVGGAGGDEVAQGSCYTLLGEVPVRRDPQHPLDYDPAAAARLQVPALSRPGYEPGNPDPKAAARPAVLRLLFYRGMQPASDGTLYPLVTPLATNQAGAAVGALSLRLAGPAGTYEQLLRGWLQVKRRGVAVKQPLRLSTLDLARLDLSRKIRLDGVEYLVRTLTASVPLRKPATAELVRV
ncbi:hypothetical protein [Hymenobacter terricola]|uniref:hypothetical protein n=1 Tax=Hymenobacter terricola TaxID=2819236 RepID=UPI001B304DE7|nr:hypothetical protein [Hymenobacter terricola]